MGKVIKGPWPLVSDSETNLIPPKNDLEWVAFDIETTGLDPKTSKMFLIGMRDNRGFLKLLSAKNEDEERIMIVDFFKTIDELKPSLIGGYNSAFFDFPFILERAKILNLNIKKI